MCEQLCDIENCTSASLCSSFCASTCKCNEATTATTTPATTTIPTTTAEPIVTIESAVTVENFNSTSQEIATGLAENLAPIENAISNQFGVDANNVTVSTILYDEGNLARRLEAQRKLTAGSSNASNASNSSTNGSQVQVCTPVTTDTGRSIDVCQADLGGKRVEFLYAVVVSGVTTSEEVLETMWAIANGTMLSIPNASGNATNETMWDPADAFQTDLAGSLQQIFAGIAVLDDVIVNGGEPQVATTTLENRVTTPSSSSTSSNTISTTSTSSSTSTTTTSPDRVPDEFPDSAGTSTASGFALLFGLIGAVTGITVPAGTAYAMNKVLRFARQRKKMEEPDSIVPKPPYQAIDVAPTPKKAEEMEKQQVRRLMKRDEPKSTVDSTGSRTPSEDWEAAPEEPFEPLQRTGIALQSWATGDQGNGDMDDEWRVMPDTPFDPMHDEHFLPPPDPERLNRTVGVLQYEWVPMADEPLESPQATFVPTKGGKPKKAPPALQERHLGIGQLIDPGRPQTSGRIDPFGPRTAAQAEWQPESEWEAMPDEAITSMDSGRAYPSGRPRPLVSPKTSASSVMPMDSEGYGGSSSVDWAAMPDEPFEEINAQAPVAMDLAMPMNDGDEDRANFPQESWAAMPDVPLTNEGALGESEWSAMPDDPLEDVRTSAWAPMPLSRAEDPSRLLEDDFGPRWRVGGLPFMEVEDETRLPPDALSTPQGGAAQTPFDLQLGIQQEEDWQPLDDEPFEDLRASDAAWRPMDDIPLIQQVGGPDSPYMTPRSRPDEAGGDADRLTNWDVMPDGELEDFNPSAVVEGAAGALQMHSSRPTWLNAEAPGTLGGFMQATVQRPPALLREVAL